MMSISISCNQPIDFTVFVGVFKIIILNELWAAKGAILNLGQAIIISFRLDLMK